jgi:pimeloyl-ACP methyl ester carboxylesterase
MVAKGRGGELLLMPGWWYAISAASLVDRIERTPDLLAHAAAISCPSLAIRGSLEPASTYPMEEFARRAAGPASYRVIEGCDHWYVGFESVVSAAIVEWLDRPGGLA